MSLVSVVLPTYNRERFLGEALAGAMGQTWPHLEILVVDDGSTDGTRQLVETLAAQDSRVRYLPQTNAGVSAARNRALEAAAGDYIAFLDSDDVWEPWKIELQVQFLRACPEVGMVWTNMDAILPDGTPSQPNFLKTMYHAYRRLPTGSPFHRFQPLAEVIPGVSSQFADVPSAQGDIYSTMFFGNLVHTPTVVLKRDWARQVGLFDTTMKRGGEDFKYHLATCRLGPVGFIDVASIKYRIGTGDQITNRENNLNFANSYLRTVRDELSQHGTRANLPQGDIRAIYCQAHDWLAAEHQAHGNSLAAVRHALLAMGYRKSPAGSWKTIAKCVLPRNIVSFGKRFQRTRTLRTASH